MHWFHLVIAGLFEVLWAVCLKLSQNFTRPLATLFTFVFMACSILFLSLALRNIPLGTAYAVWTGIGAAGVAILGIILFSEPLTLLRIIFLVLIIFGIIGLKLSSQ